MLEKSILYLYRGLGAMFTDVLNYCTSGQKKQNKTATAAQARARAARVERPEPANLRCLSQSPAPTAQGPKLRGPTLQRGHHGEHQRKSRSGP